MTSASGIVPGKWTVVESLDKIVPVQPVNTSGIEPTEFKVLVKPVEVEKVSKGGVIMPDIVIDKRQAAATEGELIAVSPLAFTYERWPEGSSPPKPGDRVAYAKYAGMTIEGRDGQRYVLMVDKDLAAVIR